MVANDILFLCHPFYVRVKAIVNMSRQCDNVDVEGLPIMIICTSTPHCIMLGFADNLAFHIEYNVFALNIK